MLSTRGLLICQKKKCSVCINAIGICLQKRRESNKTWLYDHSITQTKAMSMSRGIWYRYCQLWDTVYPKKYAHGFCFAVLCCGYALTDFPISIRLTSLALWQSNDCPSASKATLMNMDKYFMWIHYERLHNHNKAQHNKTVCILLGIYCNMFLLNYQWTVSPWKAQYDISRRISLWLTLLRVLQNV